MHSYKDYPTDKRKYYETMLKIIGSLSRLFSESDIPYLDSRVAENLYCKAFDAENKGRDDSSIDAVFGKTGIGIKTFIGTSNLQKVAEFNKDSFIFSNLTPLEKAKKIGELRNKRIEVSKNTYGVDNVIYHCIRRDRNEMTICESLMDLVKIDDIKVSKKTTEKSLKFSDGVNEYTFNASKSVLMKIFPRKGVVSSVKVKIINDPFNILNRGLAKQKNSLLKTVGTKHQFVILPLYTVNNGLKIVPTKSGLNQWNAAGRKRHEDEVYIGIPSWIHKKFMGFFPKRDTKFKLRLPDGRFISAKVCQQNDKALMSDPNKALGEWILRDVLELDRGQLLAYKMLQEIGIDSVIIQKIGNLEYSIDFRNEGEFERFKEEYSV